MTAAEFTPDLPRIRVLVAVLRSGLIPQGNSYLCRLDSDGEVTGMCCLGVASHVALSFGLSLEVGQVMRTSLLTQGNAEVRTYAGAYEFWPHEVQEWYGIMNQNPLLNTPEKGLKTATWLNDCGGDTRTGRPLSYIADCFELTYLPDEYYARYPERKR